MQSYKLGKFPRSSQMSVWRFHLIERLRSKKRAFQHRPQMQCDWTLLSVMASYSKQVEKIPLSRETSSCVSGSTRNCCNAVNSLCSHRRHKDALKPVLQHSSVNSKGEDNESLKWLFWTRTRQKMSRQCCVLAQHWILLQLHTRDNILCHSFIAGSCNTI